MHTTRTVAEADGEGRVHIEVPTGAPGSRVEVVVVWRALDAGESKSADAAGWPPDYFARYAGALTDSTFERPPQPVLDETLPLDALADR